MSDLDLRPRTVSELVDAAFTLYRRHPLQYVVVAAVAMSPVIVLELLVPSATTTASVTTSAALTQIIAWMGHVLVAGVIARAGSQAYLGGEPDVAAALRRTLPRVPAILLATLLKGFAIGLGALLLLVGAAYATARFFAVVPVVVLEDKGPLEAFDRSTELSDENKWHILKTLGLVWLIYLVVVGGVAIVSVPLNDLVEQVVDSLVAVVVYPVVGLTELALYYDTRIRNEGFDVEHMAGTLEVPAADSPWPG